MHYAMLIYVDRAAMDARSPEDMKAGMAKHVPYIEQLRKNQRYASSDALGPLRLVTRGPFAESREQLGGYYVIVADDLDEAIDIASKCPALAVPYIGGIEIRPLKRAPIEEAPKPSDAHTRFFVVTSDDDVLASPSSATTLRRSGLTDGPFDDAPIAGFRVVWARDLDEAAKTPGAIAVGETRGP